jgi:predicted RNA-binding protein YlqC (UPF0109 family)
MSTTKEFIEQIARCLVNEPEAVIVREIQGATATIYELSVASADMGRVIGKGGRVANAIRTLLHVMAAREGKRISLEIV